MYQAPRSSFSGPARAAMMGHPAAVWSHIKPRPRPCLEQWMYSALRPEVTNSEAEWVAAHLQMKASGPSEGDVPSWLDHARSGTTAGPKAVDHGPNEGISKDHEDNIGWLAYRTAYRAPGDQTVTRTGTGTYSYPVALAARHECAGQT